MPRIRTIKPDFFTSLTISELTPHARLVFVGLWTHCDDEGRCVDDARLIKAAVSPLERTVPAIEGDLKSIADLGLVLRYEVDGRRYLQVTNWREHQHINRPTASKLPTPDGTTPHARLTEESVTTHVGKGKERNREGKGTPVVALVSQSPTQGADEDGLTRIKQATNGNDSHARKTRDLILSRAPADVRDPTAYVLAAIREDPAAYRYRRGNPKRGEDCPTHAGEWADNCRGCAADQKGTA